MKTLLPEAVTRAIAAVQSYVLTTYNPLGILISGSLLRGEGDPRSDLDVFVIHDHPWRLAIVEELARHVLDVDTFFEWASAPDPTPAD